MMHHDIYRKFDGRMDAAAKAVRAKMLVIVANHDHMVNPQPALAFAESLRAKPMQLDSNCGHLAPGCSESEVVPVVRRALEMN
jgi:homoserine O-acetyltransferase